MVRWLSCFLVLMWCSLPAFNCHAQPIQFQQLDMEDGLSHNHVTNILKDKRGFLWFGTLAGLNRYDGHEFHVFRHIPNDSGSIIDNGINELFLGPKGQLWVRTQLGMNIYDDTQQRFIRNVDSVLQTMGIPTGDVLAVQCDTLANCWLLHGDGRVYRHRAVGAVVAYQEPDETPISGLALDQQGNPWVISERGAVRQLDAESLAIRWSQVLPLAESRIVANFQLLIDHRGLPWAYVRNQPYGMFWWPQRDAPPVHLTTGSSEFRLNNMNIYDLAQDQQGRIWVATDHGGVNVLDPSSGQISYLLHDDFNDRSLRHNSATAVYCDHDGITWVGTFKAGVSYYHPHQIQFTLYKHHVGASDGVLPFDDINQFTEDAIGNIWIGTNGGGLIYFDRQAHRFTQYRHDPNDPQSIGSDVIVSMLVDDEGVLWAGTYHGGLNRFNNGRFIRYLHDSADSTSISDNSAWELFEDSKGRFWVGTLNGGLNLLDKKTGRFTRMGTGSEGFTQSGYVQAIAEDHTGALWFGTASGLEVLMPNGDFRYFTYDANDPNSLANDYVSDILEDSQRRIWISTREGLSLYDNETGKFRNFRTTDGMPDNTVMAILEDQHGTIWATTTKGLSAIRQDPTNADQWRFWNYDRRDGLQASWFNEYAAYRMRSGELLFGGPAGFNIIDPAHVKHTPLFAQPILTDFQLFNSSVDAANWVSKDRIVLAHDQNVLSLVVASLHFVNKDRVRFRYTLEGFDERWFALDRQTRKATFTNLDPGEYRFNVMISADGETWSAPYTLAHISILPPFWKTGWAYLLYTLVFVGSILTIRHVERTREKTRFALQQERQQAKQLAELDKLKTRFFTNVSHEFRTPINLILAPLDKLYREAPSESTKRHLTLVERNARRLLNLVNQLLDFRKVDVQLLKPSLERGDIALAICGHAESFIDLAEDKKIDYRFTLSKTHYEAWFDPDKLERILFNLLSNAFKFTPVGGKITLDVQFAETITLTVSDTGIGIPPESLALVFDRYFQHEMPGDILNKGNGIGLAITHEYVKLLGGHITVESALEKGSTFTVVLPLEAPVSSTPSDLSAEPSTAVGKQRVLLVEDDEDFRFYLKDNLCEHFMIYEAHDASSGWAKALAVHPDIIVSDVSMPGEDGLSLCKRLKSDKRTQHIPVILLTAMAEEHMQLAGIEAGATDYITKPFNFELLRSKLHSILKQKDSMERTYKKRLDVHPSDKTVVSFDEQFMQKALEVVERQMGSSGFSVERLANEMGLSRVGLYKRILTLTGYTPSEFIRNTRIRRAAQLLEQSGLTVAEVAYQVGFNNPKQFSKYFKLLYGVAPSAYRK